MSKALYITLRACDLVSRPRRWLVPAALVVAYVVALLPAVGWARFVVGGTLVLAACAMTISYVVDQHPLSGHVPIAMVTEDMAEAGDPDPLSSVYLEWKATCERAGIRHVPPVELHPDEHIGLASTREGPRLWVGPELTQAPAVVRRHALAHEAAHLIAGHHAMGHVLQLCLEIVPNVAYVAGALTAGIGVLLGDDDLKALALTAAAVGLVSELVAAAWSREQEHAADAIAGHVLGEVVTHELVDSMNALNPGSSDASTFGTHPGWYERLDSVESHCLELGSQAFTEEVRS